MFMVYYQLIRIEVHKVWDHLRELRSLRGAKIEIGAIKIRVINSES